LSAETETFRQGLSARYTQQIAKQTWQTTTSSSSNKLTHFRIQSIVNTWQKLKSMVSYRNTEEMLITPGIESI